MPLIKQALYTFKESAVHRFRELRRRGHPSGKIRFGAILEGMKKVDPDSRKALEIAEELSKRKGEKSSR